MLVSFHDFYYPQVCLAIIFAPRGKPSLQAARARSRIAIARNERRGSAAAMGGWILEAYAQAAAGGAGAKSEPLVGDVAGGRRRSCLGKSNPPCRRGAAATWGREAGHWTLHLFV